MLARRIEEAALNSWPAQQQAFLDGWILRFAKGYTKRANSITPLYPSFLPIQDKLAFCEKLYNKQGQPTIFRLLSFQPEIQALDQALDQHGYHYHETTLVFHTRLATPTTEPSIQTVPREDWLALYAHFSRVPLAQQDHHRTILERILPESLFAVLYDEGTPVACGLGVLENGLLGLFDIVTDPEQRNRGNGTRLITDMLAWGHAHGATEAYLQVVETNEIARRLYTRIGFRELYHYWHRIQS
ncbi:acetyltransferase (GNAT) family protein [Thermosporothrix hazakensis]|jgi:GNAT superfamily N-acetyltransferase|uniref:Acetyltransferase (GNAT) family protein n=1 Tax=Thermosporothrix hazakensis TaxID=644383 RepID=A0A326UAG0_THEHA|nr:GNAT family N-acetyltransferase [Thermosporothrix hazakensis]PZW32638.1 acetyltransferase (GNAT) family protein [Thermosporothrix hazakensis]GCE49991.1 acetyltransferase, GNAT family protein [Thermosporothrix hazakensis]